jgi:UDP-N-acetylglucosamine 2-epimerase
MTPKHRIHFMRYLPPKMFIKLLNGANVLIGNSSAGIKECSYLGVPVVNVGSRQQGRLRAENVVDVPYEAEKIRKGIECQLERGRFAPSSLYSGDQTARNIANTLATVELYTEKRFYE